MAKNFLFLVSLLIIPFSIKVEAQLTYASPGCNGFYFNYTRGSAFEKNLKQLFNNLTPKTSSLNFYNSTVGTGSNRVYGLYQCRSDLSLAICSACVKDATQRITQECPFNGEGIIWYYECMLRYANRNIFSLSESDISFEQSTSANVSNYKVFSPILAATMDELINKASSSSPHYASSKKSWVLSETLYSFAQCTPDIDSFGCNSCLRSALSHITEYCGNSLSAVGFMPSCQLRYATSAFLNDPVHTGQESKKGRLTMTIIIAIAVCVSVGLIVLGFVVWICVRRRKPKEANSTPSTSSFPLPPATSSPNGLRDGTGSSFGDTQCVQYDFNTLKTATRDFSAETVLGEGGFGIVYKGTLTNGQHLAIKRLTGSPSGQGAREFMTEARLLAKLQHKNLVRLLGFCSDGDEKLLVYEFMSNASVDRFLFDPRNRPLFDWAARYKIIMGIARGLQYLHEDSRLTIIHRDLKPGNILLDSEMNPKITDFGLARLFEGAQKSANTARIVGTQGYMAPEYLMTGDYSDKSDVYSFGIMILEIVSGQKNRIPKELPQKEDLSLQVSSISHRSSLGLFASWLEQRRLTSSWTMMDDLMFEAWSLWNEGRSFELADPILSNNCPSYEVMRCIQIGLLCVQANADERPIMTAVVLMLTGSIDLPFPSTPAMLSHQYSTRTSHSGPQPSDIDLVSTKSSFSVQMN